MEIVSWVETRLGIGTFQVREVAKIVRTAPGVDPAELGGTGTNLGVLRRALPVATRMAAAHTSMAFNSHA